MVILGDQSWLGLIPNLVSMLAMMLINHTYSSSNHDYSPDIIIMTPTSTVGDVTEGLPRIALKTKLKSNSLCLPVHGVRGG